MSSDTVAHRKEIREAVDSGDYQRIEREVQEVGSLLNEVHDYIDAGEYFVKNIEADRRLTSLISDLIAALKEEREQ